MKIKRIVVKNEKKYANDVDSLITLVTQKGLDPFAEGNGLVGRLAGQKTRLLFEGKDLFFMPSQIFGNMNGRILRDGHGKPTGLLINTAFSELRLSKPE